MTTQAVMAGIAGVSALAKGIHGALQNRKANQIDKRNVLPEQQVQGEYFQNVADAEQMARTGMPAEQYNNSLNNINRNQAGALRRFSGGRTNLASILRAGNDATLGLDASDAGQRIRNRMNLFSMRERLARQKNEVFDWNKKQPYIAKLAQAQALRGAGTSNMMGAFGDITQGAAMYAMNQDGGGSTPAVGGTTGIASQPTSFGQSSSPVGQYGTRLGVGQGGGIGAGYKFPRNVSPLPFIKRFNP